jgi:hypothetical protein
MLPHKVTFTSLVLPAIPGGIWRDSPTPRAWIHDSVVTPALRATIAAVPRRARVVTWNGKDIPPELLELPAGRYVVEEEPPMLTPEEEAGIEAALES